MGSRNYQGNFVQLNTHVRYKLQIYNWRIEISNRLYHEFLSQLNCHFDIAFFEHYLLQTTTAAKQANEISTHTETPRNTTCKIANLYIEFNYHFLTLQKRIPFVLGCTVCRQVIDTQNIQSYRSIVMSQFSNKLVRKLLFSTAHWLWSLVRQHMMVSGWVRRNFKYIALEWQFDLVRRKDTVIISPWTKWPPFRRRYFHMHFLEWKYLYFDYNFTEVCSQESNRQ